MSELNARMIAAHEARDKAALVALYTEAADAANALDAECFFLSHAYIFALEAGSPQEATLRARLLAHGREEE